MPRVTLEPLAKYEFSWHLPVRSTDLNRADHLAAYALVGMLDEAYARFLDHLDLGQPGLNLGAPNVSSINADLQVAYLGEGKLHDALTIEVALRDLSTRSFRLHFRVNAANHSVALAEIGVVCFDYVAKQAVPLPQRFRDAVARLHQGS